MWLCVSSITLCNCLHLVIFFLQKPEGAPLAIRRQKSEKLVIAGSMFLNTYLWHTYVIHTYDIRHTHISWNLESYFVFRRCKYFQLPGYKLGTWVQNFILTYKTLYRWFRYFQIPIWVNFGGPWNGKCWYILRPFGICIFSHLVLFMAVWYM
jgi:hypothetical protein